MCKQRFVMVFCLLFASQALFSQPVSLEKEKEWQALSDQLASLTSLGLLSEAVTTAEKCLPQAETLFGKDHPNVALTLNNLAVVYFHQGKFAEAETLNQRALDIRQKTFGNDHPEVAVSLANMALLYQTQGRLAEAEPLYQRAIDTQERNFGKKHLSVATTLSNLAELNRLQGRFTEAGSMHQRALEIRENALGPNHPEVATSLNNLALVYFNQARYAEAEALFLQALGILETILGKDHPSVAMNLSNLGLLYDSQGRHSEAMPLHQRALGINERALGPDHVNVAMSLYNLGNAFFVQDRYAEAEPLFRRALDIQEKTFGKDHPNVAYALNSLAMLFGAQGKHVESEPLYRQALEIRERVFGKEHPDVANSLINLASFYHFQGKHAEAEPLYQRAREIQEKTLGKDHPYVAHSLNNLGALHEDQGRYVQAEPLYQRALEIRRAALGEDHTETAMSLNNLGHLKNAQGKYREAESLLQLAMQIQEKLLGHDHPDLALSAANLAFTCLSQKKYPQALELFERGIQTLEQSTVLAGGEEFSEPMRRDQAISSSRFLRAIALFQKENPEAARNSFAKGFRATEVSRSRAFLDQLAKASAEKMSGISQPDLFQLRHLDARFRALREGKTRERLKPPQARNQELMARQELLLGELRTERKTLESQFVQKYPKFVELRKPSIITVEELQQSVLQPDETLLSYWVGEEELYGFLIDQNTCRFLTHPITKKQIRDKAWVFRQALTQQVPVRTFKDTSQELYQAVLAPFLASQTLDASRTLIIAPHDALSTIPFESLLVSSTGNSFKNLDYLFHHAKVVYVPSATILRALRTEGKWRASRKRSIRPGLLLGDPVYSADQLPPPPSPHPAESLATGSQRAVLNPGARDVALVLQHLDQTKDHSATRAIQTTADEVLSLAPLPGTRTEIEAIAGILYQQQKSENVLLGSDARESKIKALNASQTLQDFSCLHFACHGILPGEVQGLAEPCLALSLYGDPREDGFLKMGEIFGLNLNADLVTLSACQTGVEDNQGAAQGISGLARAFLYAGTSRMIVTLWSVNDAATAVFMTELYKQLQGGASSHLGAIDAARRKLLLSDQLSHPFFWAPFILIGEAKE